MGHRSRSRSGCRHIPPAVYCQKSGGHSRKRRGSRSKRSKRRSRSRSRRRSHGRCGRSRSRSRRHGRRGKRSRSRRSKRRSRSRRSRRRSGKCRPGKLSKNPFLNYLRVFRVRHCKWPQYKIAIEGAKCWCKLTNKERQKFYDEACSQHKHHRKGRRGSRRRKGSRRSRRGRGKRSRSRRRSRSRKKRSGCPT